MEEKLKNFIKVWASVIITVSYCYFLSARTKAGVFRLLFVLPVCAMFLNVLPLFFSSVIFCSYTSLFLSVASVKLIQFSFGQGPLYPVSRHLLPFICFTCFHVTLKRNHKSQNHFIEPYLATSLQDFWGRRWNLMVTAILRSSVFSPVRRICTHFLNLGWATIIGVLATFIVSGVAHEVLSGPGSKERAMGAIAPGPFSCPGIIMIWGFNLYYYLRNDFLQRSSHVKS
ncbi:hypothetical protein N665_0338s0019 [Sinapis alba]|nr:hypothetical protein N665_0338s0019 [Sinapis alba]